MGKGGPASALQRAFFRMKRNFEKKGKNIARAYSKEKKEGEPHLPLLHLPATFDNKVKDFM